MRKFLLSVSFAIFLTTPAKSEFAMLGFGKESCSAMVETTSTASQMDHKYISSLILLTFLAFLLE